MICRQDEVINFYLIATLEMKNDYFSNKANLDSKTYSCEG
jgi:hypothetical protein